MSKVYYLASDNTTVNSKVSLLVLFVFLHFTFIHAEPINEKSNLDFFLDSKTQNLLISNYPEIIDSPGTIIDQKISKNKTRLIYYHKNQALNNLYINVSIRNDDNIEAKLQILDALAGPTKDGIFAGHKAVKTFFNKIIKENIKEISLAPGITRQLSYHLLKNESVSVGIIDIEKKNDVDISLKLQVIDPKYKNLSGLNEEIADKKYSYGIFGKTEAIATINYECGLLLTEIPIGKPPYLIDETNNLVLKGNYGLCYNIKIVLMNNYPSYRRVNLYFSPIGGLARATVVINGTIVETGFFNKYNDYIPEKLFEFILEPKEKKLISLKTMPEPGSNYPICFVLKTDVPEYSY